MHKIEMTREEKSGLESSGKRDLLVLNDAAERGNEAAWNAMVRDIKQTLAALEKRAADEQGMSYLNEGDRAGLYKQIAAYRRVIAKI